MSTMTPVPADALVFFGATGDLAYKKIFPALHGMAKRGTPDMPVIAVAKSGWTLDQLRSRAEDSIDRHDAVDREALDRLLRSMTYIDGDYGEASTFDALRAALGATGRPAHYLAVPPSVVELVVDQLGRGACVRDGRGRFYDQTGAIRDVVKNHLLQLLTNVAMEPPPGIDPEMVRDERVKVLKGIAPLAAADVVRGQFRGYLEEPGVAPDSTVETFVALRVGINSWRWKDVPFYIRAGKRLAASATEVVVKLRQAPAIFSDAPPPANYFRFSVSPSHTIAISSFVKVPGEILRGESVELTVSEHADPNAMSAYEELLHEALLGVSARFARQDYVEEAWRIVEPVLDGATPVPQYEPGSWGPPAADDLIAPRGSWFNPPMESRSKAAPIGPSAK